MYCNVNICKYFCDLKKEQKYKKINYYFLLIINFILFSIFSTFIFIVNEKKKNYNLFLLYDSLCIMFAYLKYHLFIIPRHHLINIKM